MSDGMMLPPAPTTRLPAEVVTSIQLAQSNLKIAQLEFDGLLATIERDYGFRFSDVVVHGDGTLAPKATP